ncbi:MAG: glycine cleavage system protein GcvH [Bacteroidota bacterium]
MNIPDHLKYSSQHEWILLDGSSGKIGITDFAQSELGDIVFVELAPVGRKVRQGESVGTIEAVKTVAELYSPVSGEVIAVNEKMKSSPEIVNKDPYGEGWMVQLRIADLKELGTLLTADAYKELIGQ